MAIYTIEIPDEVDAKFRAEFPEAEALFKTVVADAALAHDRREAAKSVPQAIRIDEEAVAVSVDKVVDAAPVAEVKDVSE